MSEDIILEIMESLDRKKGLGKRYNSISATEIVERWGYRSDFLESKVFAPSPALHRAYDYMVEIAALDLGFGIWRSNGSSSGAKLRNNCDL